jgi:hypothetical protein
MAIITLALGDEVMLLLANHAAAADHAVRLRVVLNRRLDGRFVLSDLKQQWTREFEYDHHLLYDCGSMLEVFVAKSHQERPTVSRDPSIARS